MLNIYYGERLKQPRPILEQIPGVFRAYYDPSWVEHPLAVEILEKIERVKVESPYCFKHYAYGQIAHYMLSSGVKHLLIMLHATELRDKYMFDCAYFGDNCVPYVQRIGEIYDIHLFIDRFLKWDNAHMNKHPVYSVATSTLVYSRLEEMDNYMDWSCDEDD